MGGREEYQRASQLSTSFHSTSKWVLGKLAQKGWLHGITIVQDDDDDDSNEEEEEEGEGKKNELRKRQRRKRKRRPTRLLEVGAINTELLDKAAEQRNKLDGRGEVSKYKLQVRAIDIHSMEGRIEEADFLKIPFISPNAHERYDVIVCSMVLNCVTTPEDRGTMLGRLFHHLRPGGLCFLTIPKFCLTKSAFLTPELFRDMLGYGGVGFRLEETKESPRVSFFVCQRPEDMSRTEALKPVWKQQKIRRKGKKFPNQFSVVLNDDEVFGRVKLI